MDWSSVFDEALPYADFLDRYATAVHRPRWNARHDGIQLTDEQTEMLAGFVRPLKVLVMTGAWCGDCINHVPIFAHFAAASRVIDLRLIDRDARADVADALSINGGRRVPAVLFLSEDDLEVARYGERNLSAYRRLAVAQLGAACPTGLVLPNELETVADIREWLNEFERAHWILRLSPRLRERYGD